MDELKLLAGLKVAGVKETAKAVENGRTDMVFISADAEAKVTAPIREAAESRHIRIIEVPTMQELGGACGLAVGAAVAAVLLPREMPDGR